MIIQKDNELFNPKAKAIRLWWCKLMSLGFRAFTQLARNKKSLCHGIEALRTLGSQPFGAVFG